MFCVMIIFLGSQTGNTSTPRQASNPVTIPQFSQAIGGLASPVFAMVSRNLANMTRTGQTTADMTQEPAAFVQTLRNLLQGAAVSFFCFFLKGI